MKNILLIITLLISWNAFAVEKTWFCTTEKIGGLLYKDNDWKVVPFKNDRMTVKQNGVKLSFSKNEFSAFINKCDYTLNNIIQCTGSTRMFALNEKTGLATSSSIYGWLADDGEDGSYDTLDTSIWRCESF